MSSCADFVGTLFLARDVAHSTHLSTATLERFLNDLIEVQVEGRGASRGHLLVPWLRRSGLTARSAVSTTTASLLKVPRSVRPSASVCRIAPL